MRSNIRTLVPALVIPLAAAVSSSAQSILYVRASSPSDGDGLSWSTAYTDLQDALDHARREPRVQEIWVAGGTYFPDRGTGDRDAAFELVSNVAIFGGFEGNEDARPSRIERPAVSVLSGDVGVTGDAEDNARSIVLIPVRSDNIIIDGFEVAHANGTWGAIQVQAWSTDVVVAGCKFYGNNAVWGGASFIEVAADCRLTDCDFEGNTANHGGAIYFSDSSDIIELINCRFFNNRAYGFGGAVANTSSHPVFRNCTFAGNVADREGGTISNSGGTAQFLNCILWNNAPDEIREYFSTTTASYSCIAGGWPGAGNFDLDPRFTDPAAGDLRLAPGSPCIDAGDNDAVPAWLVEDLDFQPRFADDPATPDAGRGTAPVVDLGPYEFQPRVLALLEPEPGLAGRVNRLAAVGATPGSTVHFVHGLTHGLTAVPGCPGMMVEIDGARRTGAAVADGEGAATLERFVAGRARGVEVLLQAVQADECRLSEAIAVVFE